MPFILLTALQFCLSQNKRPSSKKAEERQGACLSHHTFALFIIKTNIETCCIPAQRGQGSESCNWYFFTHQILNVCFVVGVGGGRERRQTEVASSGRKSC